MKIAYVTVDSIFKEDNVFKLVEYSNDLEFLSIYDGLIIDLDSIFKQTDYHIHKNLTKGIFEALKAKKRIMFLMTENLLTNSYYDHNGQWMNKHNCANFVNNLLGKEYLATTKVTEFVINSNYEKYFNEMDKALFYSGYGFHFVKILNSDMGASGYFEDFDTIWTQQCWDSDSIKSLYVSKHQVVFDAPEWIDNFYLFNDEKNIARVSEIASNLEELDIEKIKLETELDNTKKYKSCLYLDGDNLQDEVSKILNFMHIQNDSKVGFNEDLDVKNGELTLCIEIKGVSKAIKKQHILLTHSHITKKQAECEDENEIDKISGTLIINPEKLTAIENRKNEIFKPVIEQAKYNNVSFLTTAELLRIFEHFYPWTPELGTYFYKYLFDSNKQITLKDFIGVVKTRNP